MVPCPLCTDTTVSEVETIPYEHIWSALSKDYGADIDQEVINRHTPAEVTALVECGTCGLQYFTPAVPGDAEFYRQLTTTATGYYSEEKWDFQAVLELVGAGDNILDIACGGGPGWHGRERRVRRFVVSIPTPLP